MSALADTDPRLPVAPPAAEPHEAARPQPTFYLRAAAGLRLPPRAELVPLLQRHVLETLGGWVQLVILELIADGSVEWHADVSASLARPRVEAASKGGTVLAFPRLSVSGRRVCGASSQLFVVRCVDRRGPRRPGLWAALIVAEALAAILGGELVDLGVGALGGPPRPRPPADARVRVVHHLRLPSTAGAGRRRWLSTRGMERFGLPELELAELPEAWVERGAQLLLGVAQHLVDSAWTPPPTPARGGRRRELLLTLGELHWALGGDALGVPTTRGRGWTRVGLELAFARSWPARIRVVPPIDARPWQNMGAWIDSVWIDLFGPPPAVRSRLGATGS
ncbi:hypothetical protein PPSIR1_28008 [Plesiocystis pacifica SIR-1]|uniref:Uncharacterized protein n=1 Tax=Plesiocystis pacifica SIR-1 TaxID=391625 RepID=A6FZM4_9BACT|nr:hypothetical protein [Plesiocystis pacifica]EDM80830.1 hypothetical protein PPSIR1_28008 [Plesiocystis pacifica SIR-1]